MDNPIRASQPNTRLTRPPLQPGSVRLMLILEDDTEEIIGAEVFFTAEAAALAQATLSVGLHGQFIDYHPDKCTHTADEGCEWCCRTCNYDKHFCPGCGTLIGHKEPCCEDCKKTRKKTS